MEENKEIVEKSLTEIFEEKKEHMLTELLQTPLNIWNEEKKVVTQVKVGDIITKKDVWFSKDKPRPIINEDGFDKLVKATGATFPKIIYIEKQSDYSNVQGGQVVIEATVVFPNDEMNADLGVANALNCQQTISKANMPIMAMKRAKSRAFFRSNFVNMKVFDESEMSDELSKLFSESENKVSSLQKEVDRLNKQVNSQTKKSKDFFELVKENTLYRTRSIWTMDDFGKMKNFLEKNQAKLNPLELRLFNIRLQELEKEEKEKDKTKPKDQNTPDETNVSESNTSKENEQK